MKLILDTSILIDHLRGGGQLQSVVDGLSPGTEFYISTIVFFELFSGKSSEREEVATKIYNLVKNFQKIELDEDIATLAGKIYRNSKTRIEVPDYIIAASALSIGGTVLTLNRKHFEQIPNLPLFPL